MKPTGLLIVAGALLLTSCASVPCTLNPPVWRDGYALSFLQVINSSRPPVVHVRHLTGATWEEASSFQVYGPATNDGVGLGSRLASPWTVFGYTHGNTMRIWVGLHLTGFEGRRPDDELADVPTAPAIIHVRDNEWLIGYTRAAGNGTFEIRPYRVAAAGRLRAPLSLPGVTRNDNVAGRPAIAYYNGRLVIVWGRVADNRAFRFVAADYQPGDAAVSVVQEGDIGAPTSGYVSEFQSSPALAHDGVGAFYLATVYRSGLTGLTHDRVVVYSSPDGRTWARLSDISGDPTSPTAQTEVAIAATPAGDVMLAVVSGPSSGRMYEFRAGVWRDLGDAFASGAFPQEPSHAAQLALVRYQYLRRPVDRPEEIAYQSNRGGNAEVWLMNADGTNRRNLSRNGNSAEFMTPHDHTSPLGSPNNALYRLYSVDRQWSPDGGMILFTSDRDNLGGRPDIYVMNADGSCPTNLTRNAESEEWNPQWSPDQTMVTFETSDRSGPPFSNSEIYSMHADGSHQTNISNWPVWADVYAHWSPIGRQIAFARLLNPGSWDIFSMNPDGTGQVNLTPSRAADDSDPRWSPDGTRIAFVSYALGQDIFVMNADGSGQSNLTNTPGDDFDPQWSPDGMSLAFVTNRNGNDEIFLLDLSNPGAITQMNLTREPLGADVDPQWSREGGKIAFTTDRTGDWEVFVMGRDGANPTNLSRDPSSRDSHPQWRP